MLFVLRDKQVSSVTVEDVQQMYHKLIGRGLSTTTVRHVHSMLHLAMDAAVRSHLTAQNPTGLAVPPRAERGEICGLRWQDFDEKSGVLHVRRTLHTEDGRLVAGATKTGCGTRDIVLPDGTAEVLRKRKAGSCSEWIFPNLTKPELPISPGAAYHRLKEILKRANLPDIRFHDLRHPYVKTATTHFLRNLKEKFCFVSIAANP